MSSIPCLNKRHETAREAGSDNARGDNASCVRTYYPLDSRLILGGGMATTVPAIYENGVLRLLAPLPLPEHTAVEVTVDVQINADPEDQRDPIRAALVEAGLSRRQVAQWSGPQPLSVEERAAMVQQVAVGPPLSQLIDEEREGR